MHTRSLQTVRFLGAVLLTLCLGFATAQSAQAEPAARQALETSVTRILDIIKNPGYVNPATRAPLRRQIEDEVFHIFDFSEFSARTVGQRWASFTPAQQKKFSDAFADLLLTTYLGKIDGYNGEKVTYTGERSNAAGNRVEVSSDITMKDGKKTPVSYRMMNKNGHWCVYDVLIEGVSLVKNYRTQFQDILTTASPDELTTRVKTKALEARNGNAAK